MISTKFNSISKDNLYFIADMGANHNGDLNKALDLIHLCKEAGAHAAKFQNFSAKKIVSKFEFDNMPKKTHQANWNKSVFEVYQDASINENWTSILKEECDKIGIDYFTSPYDKNAVDHVDAFVDVYKIGSGDISWIDIIEHVISKNKPILFATGASDIVDVERVMDIINNRKAPHVLMQCNTNYTGSNENFKYINLKVLETFKKRYPESILGLSDHTAGHSTVIGAITLGATVVEKHFTDNNNNVGPDHFFAMNPSSWKEMVEKSEEIFQALGDGIKKVEENEKESFYVQRRSIVAKKNIKKGHIISVNDLDYLRPFSVNSFHPYEKEEILGKILNQDMSEGESFKRSYFE
jgi:N-acetylneuraminate synthase